MERAHEAREGRVAWIASAAEFTPTPIQTREERIAQVYAVTVRVPNTAQRRQITTAAKPMKTRVVTSIAVPLLPRLPAGLFSRLYNGNV